MQRENIYTPAIAANIERKYLYLGDSRKIQRENIYTPVVAANIARKCLYPGDSRKYSEIR